ncbi:hypothetical protein [Sulfobacillus harzensis]|uniref:Uncharacterized protein n=1 Tax=Sulfobacillus harzensis TaxID=2729629 RepID=A0A7Y0Q380_9FIRM|nr:hypothetical protein [Sulfobacillus harzensis]NMP23282.1 hypothetical protein [Sulfobacillus harzensis]
MWSNASDGRCQVAETVVDGAVFDTIVLDSPVLHDIATRDAVQDDIAAHHTALVAAAQTLFNTAV